MTIEHQTELGIYRVVCDHCGTEETVSVTDVDDTIRDYATEAGWIIRHPELRSFPTIGSRGYVEQYGQDACPDCADPSGAPKPLMINRPTRPKARDAFDNDPCDEWPRGLVWKAHGLRPDCGHSVDHRLIDCPKCRAGYPYGRHDQRWR